MNNVTQAANKQDRLYTLVISSSLVNTDGKIELKVYSKKPSRAKKASAKFIACGNPFELYGEKIWDGEYRIIDTKEEIERLAELVEEDDDLVHVHIMNKFNSEDDSY